MLILGIDFETQDDKPLTTNVTEVGASLWWKDAANVFKKVGGLSAFCWDESYPPQTAKIIDITGITDQMLEDEGVPLKVALESQLFPLMERSSFIFAHKTAFDKTILYAQSQKLGLTPPEKTWICTLTEFQWPKKMTCHKLSHLAYEHGILVDPRTLHRAENDCDLMMRLITEHYDISEVIAYAREPWAYFRADVLGPWQDNGVQNGIAKELGFSWEKCRGTDGPTWSKKWVGRFKECNVQPMLTAVENCVSPFRVSRIEGIS